MQVALNTIRELTKQKEELAKDNEQLKKTRKVTKDFSTCFIKKDGEPQAWTGLSEDKRALESRQEELLKQAIAKFTNKEFAPITGAEKKNLDEEMLKAYVN